MKGSRTSGRGAADKNAKKTSKDNGVRDSKSETGNTGTTPDISLGIGEENANDSGFFEDSALENEAGRVEEYNASSYFHDAIVQYDRIQYSSGQSRYADTTASIISNNGSYTHPYDTTYDRTFSELNQVSSPSQRSPSRQNRSTKARNTEYESTSVSHPQTSYADFPQGINGPTPLESWNYTHERHESIAYRLGGPSCITRCIATLPAEFSAENFGSYPESEH